MGEADQRLFAEVSTSDISDSRDSRASDSVATKYGSLQFTVGDRGWTFSCQIYRRSDHHLLRPFRFVASKPRSTAYSTFKCIIHSSFNWTIKGDPEAFDKYINRSTSTRLALCTCPGHIIYENGSKIPCDYTYVLQHARWLSSLFALLLLDPR